LFLCFCAKKVYGHPQFDEDDDDDDDDDEDHDDDNVCVCGPTIWNKLPQDLRSADNSETSA